MKNTLHLLVTWIVSLHVSAFKFSRPLSPRHAFSQSLATPATTSPYPDKFNSVLGVILAGYAFEVYNTPPNGKAAVGLDATKVVYCSPQYIRSVCKGELRISIEKGAKLVGEEQFIESALSGDKLDPYVVVIPMDKASMSGRRRVCDSSRSSTKYNDDNPIWRETFLLCVLDPLDTEVQFLVFDEDFTKDDDFIGFGSFLVTDLIDEIGQSAVHLPIPIYNEVVDDGNFILSLFQKRTKRARTGTLGVKIQYISWTPEGSDYLCAMYNSI